MSNTNFPFESLNSYFQARWRPRTVDIVELDCDRVFIDFNFVAECLALKDWGPLIEYMEGRLEVRCRTAMDIAQEVLDAAINPHKEI